MCSPTSTSALSIGKISQAAPASRPRLRTFLEMCSGFSSTSLCVAVMWRLLARRQWPDDDPVAVRVSWYSGSRPR
jgi:hypothetical protein